MHVAKLMGLTRDVQFFQKISIEQNSEEVHRECCKVMTLEEYSQEDIIFNFGDKGDKFFIILSGSVSVKTPARKKVTISRNTAKKIEHLLNTSSESEPSEVAEEDFVKKKREIHIKVNIVNMLNCLQPKMLKMPFENTEKKSFLDAEEQSLLRLFKTKVKSEQRILMNAIKHTDKDHLEIELDDFVEIGILYNGNSFGELALISERPRSATIEVRERSSFFVLNKADFTIILGDIAEKRLNTLIKFLQNVSLFQARSKSSLVKLAYYFQPRRYKRGQVVYKEHDPVDGVYLIKDGEITVTKKRFLPFSETPSVFSSSPSDFFGKKSKKKTNTTDVKIIIKAANQFFGGYEIFKYIESRIYTCTCTSATSECYYMSKMSFLSRIPHLDLVKDPIFEDHERVMERYKELCKVEDGILKSVASRSLTPAIKTINDMSFTRKNTGMKFNMHSSSKKSLSKLKKSSDSRYLRKLTEQEIHDAIHGRQTILRKYGSRLNCDSSFAS
ncbi:hypothetical protein SteCoe_15580 [Stentor coeruleus]|uniref:Cyclic nucleotide-binding domain-containing protein n=1 Tax=Stentor coeruleus TaxID=5963 RepID=A0A1R2C366_9CILI|nr:hypothetical protein SteCoe_15580 [Stentor coeruleus]